MAVRDRGVVWSFMFLLAGAAAQSVIYPFTTTCAVKGSTVTLPCTFTPLRSAIKNGGTIQLEIIRVGWCKNHPICQDMKPVVYDSQLQKNNPRFLYLGDMKKNCTLQIRDAQKEEDNITFRFRMEANDTAGHFTNMTGVKVTVIDGNKMRINVPDDDRELRRGDTVTLRCTSVCTFHHLEVTWLKDGHALPQSGPALQIGPLSSGDSGNYTCALKTNMKTRSLQYSLQVEAAEEDADGNLPLISVVCGVLLAVITLILVFFIIKRKRSAAERQRAVGDETEQKPDDNVYSSVVLPSQREGWDQRQEASRAVEDVSYATVQFKHQRPSRQVSEAEDAVIYSALASRG